MYIIAKKSLGQRDTLTGLNVTLTRVWKGFHMIHELPQIESVNQEKQMKASCVSWIIHLLWIVIYWSCHRWIVIEQ